MEVSSQLHAPAALALAPIGWEAGWVPESVWTQDLPIILHLISLINNNNNNPETIPGKHSIDNLRRKNAVQRTSCILRKVLKGKG
jgi:hypothetical protein